MDIFVTILIAVLRVLIPALLNKNNKDAVNELQSKIAALEERLESSRRAREVEREISNISNNPVDVKTPDGGINFDFFNNR